MMESRKFFLSAVIVALIFPIIISSVYFMHMSRTNQRGEYITRLENGTDLEMVGDNKFDNISGIKDGDFTKGTKLEFMVKYFSGKEHVLNYSINIDISKLPRNMSGKEIFWQLLYFDDVSNSYLPIKTGNLENSVDGLELHKMSIILKGIHKYVLYLYSTVGNQNIYGNITVEKV